MTRRLVGPDTSGKLPPITVPSGASHTFVTRTLTLDHRYHDDDPVQDADFWVTLPGGVEVHGRLDKTGRATLVGVPEVVKVRYGPDARPFERADKRENPDKRDSFGDGDFDALYEKYKS